MISLLVAKACVRKAILQRYAVGCLRPFASLRLHAPSALRRGAPGMRTQWHGAVGTNAGYRQPAANWY